MFFQSVDLTTAHRPQLQPDETLLFVQDAVGLYEGKFKIPAYQHGHVYLTTHRICYVDNEEPRKNSAAIELKDVEKYEIVAGFLKSSPKITLYPKPPDPLALRNRTLYAESSPTRSGSSSPRPKNGGFSSPLVAPSASQQQAITWVCPICSLSNDLPRNFDPRVANEYTALPPCQACGIKPPLALLLKAAIASATRHGTPRAQQQATPDHSAASPVDATFSQLSLSAEPSIACPRCTFQNHPSLLACEMCGATLVSLAETELAPRPDSPGPSLDRRDLVVEDAPESVKFSFRAGGEKICYERLKGAIIQRKWLLPSAPPAPHPNLTSLRGGDSRSPSNSGRATPEPRAVGIAGLEQLGLERRMNNETVISTSFEDLEALMASAKEIMEMAESFAETSPGTSARSLLEESAALVSMAPTKDLMTSKSGNDALYLNELSRNLAEYLTDDRQSVLKKEGGIMSIVDLWAKFNRARNGVELVSASDFEKAARQWEKLSLPVRLRAFKNGLLVVQPADWTDDKTIAMLLSWMQDFHFKKPQEAQWDWELLGKGVTAQETAANFGWSVGVATEELEMAEEKGILCREESIEGLKFWENWILDGDDETIDQQ